MELESQQETTDLKVIHSGFTHFPTLRHILTLLILGILEAEGIYLSIPLTRNSSISFLIGQIVLLSVIIYSWLHILGTTPGPMSQLFNEELIRKTIQQGLNANGPNELNRICTKCQIEKVTKIYNCQQCNRCVYKFFFHSQWLNTCIAKENFPSSIAFLIFFEIYLILLGIDNIFYFFGRWSQVQIGFKDFFLASFQNSLVISFIFILSVSIFAVTCMIVSSYYYAFRSRVSIEPINCNKRCQGLEKIDTNDKILHRIRQSVRVSQFNRQQDPSDLASNQNLFRETQDLTGLQFIFRAFKKSNIKHSQIKEQNRFQRKCKESKNQGLSNENSQNPLFKTDFFSSALYLNKRKYSIQRANRRKDSRLEGIFDDISNITREEQKMYISSVFGKKINAIKNYQLAEGIQMKVGQQQQNSSLSSSRSSSKMESQPLRSPSMRASSLVRKKTIAKTQQEDVNKENILASPSKKIRFRKKLSVIENLAAIFQNQSKSQEVQREK